MLQNHRIRHHFTPTVCAFLLALTNPAAADQLSRAWSALDKGDYVQAKKLLRPLAKQGSAIAQFNLGFIYSEAHQGIPKNYVLAYMWADIAAANATDADHRKQYANLRDSVATKMTARQIKAARQLEKQCLADKFKGC